MNESETRAEYIDPKLKESGWGEVEGSKILREFLITGGRIQTIKTTHADSAGQNNFSGEMELPHRVQISFQDFAQKKFELRSKNTASWDFAS